MRRQECELLEMRVVYGIVRCGICGWLIRKDSAWRTGDNGLQHQTCEYEVCPGGPPGGSVGPRLWSHDSGAPFDND